jgi:phosphodiesterase/alkaline phosphatase D-like protein
MEDGSIDFVDGDKNTTAMVDLTNLSDNTNYYYKFPAKSGTLATTKPLSSAAKKITLLGPSGSGAQGVYVDLDDDLDGPGYYHV